MVALVGGDGLLRHIEQFGELDLGQALTLAQRRQALAEGDEKDTFFVAGKGARVNYRFKRIFALAPLLVRGSTDMDRDAFRELSEVPDSETKETGVAVLKDGSTISPTRCGNNDCSFALDLATLYYVAHRHVLSNNPDRQIADPTNILRELPGPGDHAFLVLGSVPNYFLTPTGVFKVLEYSGEGYEVRTILGPDAGNVTPWRPSDSIYKRPIR